MEEDVVGKSHQLQQQSHYPVAIVGGSYAGLVLANVLHQHTIPFVIFDSRSIPYVHVCGGEFNVPSFVSICQKLGLQRKLVKLHKSNVVYSIRETRKSVIECLLQHVRVNNMISSVRIVRIEKSTDGLFFLYSSSSSSTYGPYRTVVGADGVFSIVRSHAHKGTYLIGDARWVQDVSWYDLGTTRIAKGANMAMMDGSELGMILVDNFQCKNDGDMSMTTMTTHVYCARKIYEQRVIRWCFFTFASIAIIVAIRAMSTSNLSQISVCHNDHMNQTQNVVRWHKQFRKKKHVEHRKYTSNRIR